MEQVAIGLLGLCGIGFLGCVWALIANEITFRQRNRMIDAIYERPDWEALARNFHRVTYEDHHFRLMTMRNPMRLYVAPLQALAA